jgi:hypothetical protein
MHDELLPAKLRGSMNRAALRRHHASVRGRLPFIE